MKEQQTTTAIVFEILFSATLIGVLFLLWKYMTLRKDIAIVTLKTKTPTATQISTAVKATQDAADAIIKLATPAA